MRRTIPLFVLVITLSTFAFAQTSGIRKRDAAGRDQSIKQSSATFEPAAGANSVIGSGAAGQISKWTGVDGSNTFSIGNANIFEDKFGRIGIGTPAPTSLLTVQGMIETTLGGYKFPDGTIQTTAGIAFVTHDDSLMGDGKSATPLGIALGGVKTIHLANGAVTATKLANSTVVRSLNGLFDNVSLLAGSNITITPGANTLTVATTGLLGSVAHGATLTGSGTTASPLDVTNGGIGNAQLVDGAVTAAKIASGQAVKSLNSIKDDVTLAAGSNITITPSGNTLTINTSGISQVVHDNTLKGTGTSGTPLGVSIPLSLSGSVSPVAALYVENTRVSGLGIHGVGDGIAILGETTSSFGYGGVFHGNVNISGDLLVGGDKDFVEPHPTDPSKMIAYVCLEGREAGTYFRGSGRIVNGSAMIDVPEDFRMVSDENGLTVQVTPMGAPATIWCVAKSLDKIELRASADVEFDYTVNGVRKMSKDRKPIVDNSVFIPLGPDDNLSQRIRNPEAIRRLKASGILNEDGSVNLETVQKLDTYKRQQKRQ